MPSQKGTLLRRDFTRGLITETSALAFPENASSDELNVDISGKGTRKRRLGFDLESGHVASVLSDVPSDFFSSYVSTGRWTSPGGDGNLEFATCQIGNKLYFFNTAVQPVTEQTLNDTRTASNTPLDMDDFISIGGASLSITGNPVTTATGNGFLFVAGADIDPFYVKYDIDTEEITSVSITLKIRDKEGLDDSLDDNERPSSLSDEHEYNLLNQGWYIDDIKETDGTTVKPLNRFFSRNNVWPSNADVWWRGRGAGGDAQAWEDNVKQTDTVFTRSNTKAPRGHYILDAFYRDRASEVNDDQGGGNSNNPGLSVDVEEYGSSRPTTVAFFAGRVWYAGQQGRLNSTLFFSQVLEGEEEIPKCYQKNDPTDEENSQILATDGGTIKIPEIGKVVKLQPFGDWLLVMCSNGIWAIGGGSEQQFTAESFRLKKVSSVNCISSFTTVDARGTPVFWSDSGIYLVDVSQVDGSPVIQNLSEKTIQTFYKDDIPALSKLYATGAFDFINNRIYWLYRSTLPASTETFFEYDRLLILDLKFGSFLPWEVYAGSFFGGPHIMGVVSLPSVGSFLDTEVVTDGGETVTDSAVTVTVNTLTLSASDSAVKFLIKKNPLFIDVIGSLNLNNFDFEAGSLTGWTTNNGWFIGSSAGPFFVSAIPKPPEWDTYYANASNGTIPAANTTGTLSRTISLTSLSQDILDGIDSGGYEFEVSWDAISYNPGPPFDQHGATITFKDSLGATITTLSLANQNYPDTVSGQEPDVYTLGPTAAIGCRSIDIEIRVVNDSQVGLNYVLDNLYISLSNPNVSAGEVNTNLEVTFGDFWRTDSYVDWSSVFTGGQSFSSFLETGHEYGDTPTTFKTAPYIYVYMNRDDTASLFLQGKWDFSRLTDSSEFGTPQRQAYRELQDAREVVVTRNKIRGRGRALKLRFEAETTKPFELLGWATELEQGTNS